METHQEEVLIVSRTKMESGVCVGGIGLTSKKNLRINKESFKTPPTELAMNMEELSAVLEERKKKGTADQQETQQIVSIQSVNIDDLNIGDIFSMSYNHEPNLVHPHIEDIRIKNAKLIKKIDLTEVKSYIYSLEVTIWEGGLDSVFDGLLKFYSEDRGAAYVAESSGFPSCSVGFWLPDGDLLFVENKYDGKIKRRYCYGLKRMAYVGFEDPISVIQSGTLVRLSLPRPKKFDEVEPRCYLQLSGWYN